MKTATRPDTREILIAAGKKMMLTKGFNNTGIQEIVSASGVPKGSFYHYFESKEAFAVAVIESFDRCQSDKLDKNLRDEANSPLLRLERYFESMARDFAEHPCMGGCLVGTLSQEMSGQSEQLRTRLASVLDGWKDRIAACLEEGQKAREIREDLCPHELAEVVLSGWEGAVLRSKATNGLAPVESFRSILPKLLARQI